MNEIEKFKKEKLERINSYPNSSSFHEESQQWMNNAFINKYMYNYEVCGVPIIQLPTDMVVIQEIIWETKPDLIIETGIAHGGSLLLSAMMLALLDYCDAINSGNMLNVNNMKRRVLGIDVDIRKHNRKTIESHPMSNSIDMIEGSSISEDIIKKVREIALNYKRVLIFLDSNHTYEHVLAELKAYAPLVSKNSYCVVFDTIVDDLPDELFQDKPWGANNNPKTAVHSYLSMLEKNTIKAADGNILKFEIDKLIDNKLLITSSPNGYLKRF